ncbi:nose resistant to fluoxetine protein 6-like protein [Dinothrombium tinctorium]|uniref:Nose resistant to fluoxetine protein 6-like protein n=1 Tax=Dinothrombium tinctorium TaxID=1965070 RepID=A0A443RL55_9ACAR|nr:nose resistant to fluoxetine protein 6-like protein [Dinothrombium tinctorium]
MGHNRKTSFLLLSILIVFASTKINADEEDDDLEGFTLPSFTLHPIVDLLNKEEPSPPPPNDTDVDDSGVFDKISVGSLFSKFLRRPKGSKRLIPENATHEEVYIRLSHMLDQEIEVMIKEILPFALEYQQDRVNTTPRCSNSMLNFGAAMREKTSWAFKFLDSMGKIPSGLLEGTLSDFGNFDQCLDAEVTTEVSWIGVQPILYKGSYCLVEIEPPLPKIKDRLKYETVVLNYTNTELHTTFFNRWATYVHDYYSYPIAIGMCMPSTCTAKEVEKVMANGKNFHFLTNNQETFQNLVMRQYNMSVRVGPNCNSRDQVFEKSFPFFQISVILLIGGFVALASLHEYCAFSYEKPAKKKILTKTEEEKLYTGNETESLKYEVTLQSLHGIKVITLMWVVIVDVYLMGGLPLSNLISPIFERNALEITSKCESNWWSNIFFLNNWFKVDNMCLQQTWILSVGFQLYFLAFFVIVAIYKAPVLGFIMTTLLILVGIVVPGFVTFLYKLPPTFILDNPYIKQVKEDLEINFFPTFNHFTPYFVGVLVGYLIFKKKQALNKNMVDNLTLSQLENF